MIFSCGNHPSTTTSKAHFGNFSFKMFTHREKTGIFYWEKLHLRLIEIKAVKKSIQKRKYEAKRRLNVGGMKDSSKGAGIMK